MNITKAISTRSLGTTRIDPVAWMWRGGSVTETGNADRVFVLASAFGNGFLVVGRTLLALADRTEADAACALVNRRVHAGNPSKPERFEVVCV